MSAISRAKRRPKKSVTPDVDSAIAWAKDVLGGSRPVCRYITAALERHFKDLERSAANDPLFPYEFDAKRAQRRLELMQALPHTKGKWANQRLLITLEPWQAFGQAMVFGWVNKQTKFRRFREAYWEVPRKNGKSVIAAGTGIIMLVADNEFGSEVYCGAGTLNQAMEVFKPAKIMLERTPELAKAAGIQINAQSVVVPEQGSVFRPIVGDPGDGASPSCALIDEFHEHINGNLYDTMSTGMGAREQPLIFIITTAGSNIAGPCYAKRKECLEMLAGTVPEETLFAYIWTIDPEDDWTDPKNLEKANPNYGISVGQEYLLASLRKAINHPRHAAPFQTKHLNIWTASKAGFFNMATWDKLADHTLSLDQFAGEPCILSGDLARKLDLNSMVRLFWRDIDGRRHYYCIAPKFYCPEDTIYDSENKRMSERLVTWLNMELLTETSGAEIDLRQIFEDAKTINAVNPVAAFPIDPHGAIALTHDLDDEGMTPVTVTQNFNFMSSPMKELEAAVEAGRFHHDGNEIMTWCIGNVVGKTMPGNDDVVRPIKEHVDNKIDGAVALMMAIGQAMVDTPKTEGDLADFLNNPLAM